MEAVKPTPILPAGALRGGQVQPPPELLTYWHDNPHLSIHQATRDMNNWIAQYAEQEARLCA